MKVFNVGTRKSQLALVQTYQVKAMLEKSNPNAQFSVVEMSTKGDEVLDRALYKIGDKSLFTKELENALYSGDVRMVVHSLKDLPSQLPEGLVIGAILERVPPVDVIIMKAGSPFSTWEDLLKAEKAVVGTSAVRRIAQLQGKYPNLTFMDIRGNLNTRLKKLDDPEGPYDAIILAKAGIMRLDWQHRIHRELRRDECLHAVGQGALAVECKADDLEVLQLLKELNHKDTVLSVMAERALMRKMEGGCSAPLAAHAELQNDRQLHIEAGVWSLDGKCFVRKSLVQDLKEMPEENLGSSYSSIAVPLNNGDGEYFMAHSAGIRMAHELSENGGQAILQEAKKQVEEMRKSS